MKRRQFVAVSCLAGLASLSKPAEADDAGNPAGKADKQYYELRLYRLQAGPKEKLLDDFLRDAAIPALNRIGIAPVGVLKLLEGNSPDLYVLLPHKSLESVVTAGARLLADREYLKAGAALLDASFKDPVYERVESSLMVAFDGMPKLEVPVKGESRVLQLRTYESATDKAAQRKIEMFNKAGEIAIFRRTGLAPVFFGQTLIGAKLPNLTYMVAFPDMETNKANWDKFRKDPDWLKLKDDPYFKDTVSNITNLLLRPAACSQI